MHQASEKYTFRNELKKTLQKSEAFFFIFFLPAYSRYVEYKLQ